MTTVITGGASFIAMAVADRLVGAGESVVLADRDEAAREQLESLLGSSGRYLVGDVTDDAFLDEMVSVATGLGPLTGAVHAAVTFDDALYDTSRADWHRSLDVNLVSAAMLTQKVIPHMETAGAGSVVYVASISGYRAQPARMVYSVTKAALHMLAKTGGTQLAQRGIRVNSVSPGWTWSRNLEQRYRTRDRADAFAAEFQTMGRMADPDEIAAGIQWLLSPEASFVTATDLLIDGGYAANSPEAMGQAFDKFPPRLEENHGEIH